MTAIVSRASAFFLLWLAVAGFKSSDLPVGVAVAAVCIQLIQAGFGDATLKAHDLSLAFAGVAAISSLSTLVFMRLKPDAGAALAARAPLDDESAPAAAE